MLSSGASLTSRGRQYSVLDIAYINDVIGQTPNGVEAYSSEGRPATVTLEEMSDSFIKN